MRKIEKDEIPYIEEEAIDSYRKELIAKTNMTTRQVEEELKRYVKVTSNIFESFAETANEFLANTEGEDELQVVLRTHLYIERELTEILKISLAEPDYILNTRFMFANKLNLAVALGVFPIGVKKAYDKLNKMRNKFAHELEFYCSEDDLRKLEEAMVDDLGELYRVMGRLEPTETLLYRLRIIFTVMWAYTKQVKLLIPIRQERESLIYKLGTIQREIMDTKGLSIK